MLVVLKSAIWKIRESVRVYGQVLSIPGGSPAGRTVHVSQCALAAITLVLWHTKTTLAQAGFSGMTKTNCAAVSNAVNAVMTYMEGTFGAVLVLSTGLLAILCFVAWVSERRAWRLVSAILLAVLALGIFLLRGLMVTFFNDLSIRQ